jgi:hypothetical protein
MNDRDDEKLERLIGAATAGLPLRRAPAGLEQRVSEEIARRAALPWWRRGFAQWPTAARTGFVIVGVLLAGLSLTNGFTPHVGAQALIWVRPFVDLMATFASMLALGARLVPALWIYLSLSVGALLYTCLFGLGAFAYRTLYLQNPNTAMIRS